MSEIETQSGHVTGNKKIRFGDYFMNLWNTRRNTVLAFAGAVALLVGGGIWYKMYYLPGKDVKGQNMAYQAFELFSKDSFNQLIKGSKGLPAITKLAGEYSGTASGMQLNYMAGISLLRTGKYKEAIDYLEDADFGDHSLSMIAVGATGDCYSQLKQYDKASSHYQKAARMFENEYLTPTYLRKAGICEEKNGNHDKAIDLYTEIKKKYSKSQIAFDIDRYIGRAEAAAGRYNR